MKRFAAGFSDQMMSRPLGLGVRFGLPSGRMGLSNIHQWAAGAAPISDVDRPAYRADIDGLRAIAVLSVVGYHALPLYVQGGFVGVDIFFVISGFLISTIIFDSLDDGRFSVAGFYSRRIKRIFPALLLVMAVTLAFGWGAMLAREYKQLGKHVAGGATFVSNFVLWGESGYFSDAADTKPFLHLWSLGIEEQFYIVWPLTLWGAYRLRINPLIVTAVLLVASFALNISDVGRDAVASFYSPLTRAWELLAGAVLACVIRNRPHVGFGVTRNLAALAALTATVLTAVVLPKNSQFPGWWAVVPVMGTVILIAAGPKTFFNRAVLSSRTLVWIGPISYPLYLWHWPLLSYARILEGETPSIEIRTCAVIFSILLAWMTYKFVEAPIRFGVASDAKTPVLIAGMTVVCLLGLAVYTEDGLGWRNREIDAYNDLPIIDPPLSEPSCTKRFAAVFSDQFIQERDICLLKGDHPSVLLIGDSHALGLFDGLVDLGVDRLLVLGRGSCAPLMDNPRDAWLKCQPVQDRILDFGLRSDFRLLVVTGTFERFFDGTYSVDQTRIEENIQRSIAALGNSQRDILIVLDNPSLPFDASVCLKRPIQLKDRPDCSFDRAYHDNKAAHYKALFTKYASAYSNIRLLDASQYFCNSQKCFAYNDEGLVYSTDRNHLNMRGTKLIDAEILRMYPAVFRSPPLQKARQAQPARP
jgi:peptidoglycan/LPS O-acetylase OafA/YrhL